MLNKTREELAQALGITEDRMAAFEEIFDGFDEELQRGQKAAAELDKIRKHRERQQRRDTNGKHRNLEEIRRLLEADDPEELEAASLAADELKAYLAHRRRSELAEREAAKAQQAKVDQLAEQWENAQKADLDRRLKGAVEPHLKELLYETAISDGFRRVRQFLEPDGDGFRVVDPKTKQELLHPKEKRPMTIPELVADLSQGQITGEAAPHLFRPRHEGRPTRPHAIPAGGTGAVLHTDAKSSLEFYDQNK